MSIDGVSSLGGTINGCTAAINQPIKAAEQSKKLDIILQGECSAVLINTPSR